MEEILDNSSILMELQQKGGTVSRAMMGEWEMKERAWASGRVEEMGEEDKSVMEEVAVNCMSGQAKQMKEALLMYSMLSSFFKLYYFKYLYIVLLCTMTLYL